MFFPPVVVLVPAAEAIDLKRMLEETFGQFRVTDIHSASQDKAAVYVEFGNVKQSDETEAMRESLRATGIYHGRFHLVAQMF